MDDGEILELVRLYRRASGDLAYAAAEMSNPDLVEYLNGIVGKGYAMLYRRPTKRFADAMLEGLYLAASTFRKRWKPIAFSAAFFFFSAFAAILLYKLFPNTQSVLLPPGMEANFDSWLTGEHQQRTVAESNMMSAMYATNNPRVAIMTNALNAFTFGIFGIFSMWQNGAIVGLLGMKMAEVGQLGFLLSSIAPHGVSEIGGIFVSCGAGFVLANATINPGRRSRSAALREAGKDAFVLLMLSLVMIFMAAPIEGFFSFSPAIPQWVKAVFAIVALTGWLTYLVGYDRKRTANEEIARAALAEKLPEHRVRQLGV
jgi:uncharacterized membrane protein SpoIIM required for sporulation